MTDLAERPLDQAGVPRAPRTTRLRMLERETKLMLVVTPALVAVTLAAFVVWRQTATLDQIESNALAWSSIARLTWQHIQLTLAASSLVVAIAVPLGIALTRGRLRRFSPVIVGIANIGQAAPALGLVVLLYIALNDVPHLSDFWIAVLALTLYGLLPALRNTITGLDGVDRTLVEAGRGLGMSGTKVLLRIELPLALPVIMTGVRTALVLVVGTATLATFVNGGGLGAIINTGITLYRFEVMIAGAVLVAMLALMIEWLGRLLEAFARPRGV